MPYQKFKHFQQHEDIRRKSANYQIIGTPDSQWGPLFEALSINLAEAPPVLPRPLDQDGLLGLFDASETGADYKLQPALPEDMCASGALKRHGVRRQSDRLWTLRAPGTPASPGNMS